MIRSYQKAELLIIDEFLLTLMTNEQANDLLEVIELRTAGMNGASHRFGIICVSNSMMI